jgi:hypothetical protein
MTLPLSMKLGWMRLIIGSSFIRLEGFYHFLNCQIQGRRYLIRLFFIIICFALI